MFLTADELPANVLVRKGDAVQLLHQRSVHRVGYRLGIGDAPSMTSDAELHVRALVRKATGNRLQRCPHKARKLLDRWWAVTWLAAEGMGGTDRGVHLAGAGCDCTWQAEGRAPRPTRTWRVISKRNNRVGTYYPPSGDGEDYMDGGLENARTVVVVTIQCQRCYERLDVLSGDLCPTEAAGNQ